MNSGPGGSGYFCAERKPIAPLATQVLEVIVTDKTRRFSQRAAAMAVSLLLGTAAQAGLVRGNLDPDAIVGVPAYNGFADFQVDNNCLVGDGWKPTGTGSGDCGAVFMQSATIFLYGNTPGDPATPPPLGQANFGSSSISQVSGILTQGGVVLGIDTDILGPVSGTDFYSDSSFWLEFVTGCNAQPSCGGFFGPLNFQTAGVVGPSPFANLYQGTACEGDFCFPTSDPSRTNTLVFVAIPEPGTISLLLTALGLGFLARRREKNSAA